MWHVPNGEIRRVGNMSQHWSRAVMDIDVAYDTDLEHAQVGIKRVADEFWRAGHDVLEEPDLLGVEALGQHAVTIRLLVKTRPSRQWVVARELRQQIKVAFDAEEIEMPFPQQTVWTRPHPAATS